MSQNEATTLRKQRSLSLSEITRPSLSRSRNICHDPKLLADMSQLRCQPSPMIPRQSAPAFPGHALDSIQAPASDKISMQPKSSQRPSPTTLPNNWKPIPPPKPWSRSASPNPSQGRLLCPHPDIELLRSHSSDQISTNKAILPTSKSPSHFLKVLLPVPHHKITHATKSDVEDSANSSLPSAAFPKKVARLTPKEQAKVDSKSKSAKEGSRNEAAQKRFMYFNKSAGDSRDYVINDIGIGNDKSSCIDLMVEKNTAYGVVEMGLGDESSPVVTAAESSGYEYVDMGIGNGPIVKKNTTGGPGVYAYVDVGFEKPPTTVEESIAGESGEYEYVDVGFDKPPSTVKNNVVGKSTVDLRALQQKQTIGDKHPALVGLQANGPQKTRDIGKTNQNGSKVKSKGHGYLSESAASYVSKLCILKESAGSRLASYLYGFMPRKHLTSYIVVVE